MNFRHFLLVCLLGLAPGWMYLIARTFSREIFNGVGGCRQIPVDRDAALSVAQNTPVCACIIGASTGIGQELAVLLSQKPGVKLILTGRTENRAKSAIPTTSSNKEDVHPSVILPAALDLASEKSITTFSNQLSQTVDKNCQGKLDYLFLNAAQIYLGENSTNFISADGKHDWLFQINFLSYITLLRELKQLRLSLTTTRVVFVSSVAHYTGVAQDVLVPNLGAKKTYTEQMSAYCTTKLAFTTMEHVLGKEGILQNAVSVTCGAALTSINVVEADRLKGITGDHNSTLLMRFHSKLQLAAREGAEVVLDAALLNKGDAKPGDLVLPYFYGFASLVNEQNPISKLVPYSLKLVLSIAYEHLFQRMTYKPNHVWVCPASVESRDEQFQKKVKNLYLRDLL